MNIDNITHIERAQEEKKETHSILHFVGGEQMEVLVKFEDFVNASDLMRISANIIVNFSRVMFVLRTHRSGHARKGRIDLHGLPYPLEINATYFNICRDRAREAGKESPHQIAVRLWNEKMADLVDNMEINGQELVDAYSENLHNTPETNRTVVISFARMGIDKCARLTAFLEENDIPVIEMVKK